jgi:cellulose synthase/poly-beta-1,6-N-acetylglucosamine synthase-like glycosyltransferase
MNKLPTVTLATTALNEAENITAFLESVLSQKELGYKLSKILVVSDGSTDDTVKKVKAFKNKKIQVKDFETRMGKPTRLNYIYKNIDTDILVQCDSDVILGNDLAISNIVKAVCSSKNTMLSGGNSQPFIATTVLERAIHCTHRAYSRLRKYSNSLTVTGCLMASKREFISKITIPNSIVGDDIYLYFSCLSLGYTYKYAKNAIVYFSTPKTVSDQLKQNARFLVSPTKMTKYFPLELVKKEDWLPVTEVIKSFLYEFIRHPLLCSYIMTINLYCRLIAFAQSPSFDAKWSVASSTKNQ